MKKSVKKCSISNALDSTEDDLIWNNKEKIEDSKLEIKLADELEDIISNSSE